MPKTKGCQLAKGHGLLDYIATLSIKLKGREQWWLLNNFAYCARTFDSSAVCMILLDAGYLTFI